MKVNFQILIGMRAKARGIVMRKFFKIYWPFALNYIKSNFVYKGRFYLFILRKFLGMFIYYYLWMAIYASSASDQLGGFTRSEMILYVLCRIRYRIWLWLEFPQKSEAMLLMEM